MFDKFESILSDLPRSKPEGARLTRETLEDRWTAADHVDTEELRDWYHALYADYRRIADALARVAAMPHGPICRVRPCSCYVAIARENCPPGWEGK